MKEFSSVGGVKGARTKLEGGVICWCFFQRSLRHRYSRVLWHEFGRIVKLNDDRGWGLEVSAQFS